MSELILECKNVSKIFSEYNYTNVVLSNVDLQVFPGQQIAIMGRSGSGKTTLLQLLGGLDVPTTGIVKLCGKDLNTMTENLQTKLRNLQIGFIYQLHHLIPEFTALENVCLPLLIQQQSFKVAKDLGSKLLTEVGLQHRLNFYPRELSGGERQRVAVVRAIITHPACILADEPTGNLDTTSAAMVMDLMRAISKRYNSAIIMVTHDATLAASFDKIYTLENGVIQLCQA